MIYQDVYSSIQQPTSMYGLRKQVEQDQLVAQQNQIAIQQKARAEQEAKAKALYQSMNQFNGLSDDKQSAMYQTYRQKWESLMPEAKGIFPSVWDSKDPTNKESLGQVISFLEPLVPAEEYTLSEGQVRIAQRPGGKPTVVARGGEKGGAGFEIKRIPVDGGLVEIPQDILPSGNILAGPFVYDRFDMSNSMPKEEYFKLYPSERPVDIRPESRNKLNATPQPVPGQTELPPRQFNAPSPTNRAGETNVGFPIDENAMMQQPQIMPTMGNLMLRGAGAVMADEFAPQPRNALVGGMMPQPSQFAELMPAGSAPNRFGSPGVEGIDFAATGSAKPQLINGLVVYPGRPKPVDKNETPVFRPLSPQEIIKEGQDPARVTGRISQFGQIEWKDKKTPEQIKSEEAQGQSATAQAYESTGSAMKLRADKLTVLRGIKRYRQVLNKIGNQKVVDTGPIDQFITKYTDLGSELDGLKESVGEQFLAAFKVKGDPATQDELEKKKAQLPVTGRRLYQNFNNLNMVEEYILAQVGVQAMISNDEEWKALPPNTKYIDLRDGTPRIRRALPGEQVK